MSVKTTAHHNPKRLIGLKISLIGRQMRQLFDSRVERMGVTRAKWMLIGAVANNQGSTQRELATDLDVTDVTAGRLIEKVCADGLLERRPHPQDRRAYCVHLTPAAQPVLEKLAKAAIAFESEMFANIDDADVEALNALLDRISQNLARSVSTGDDRRGATPD